ncbi:hypothetical protein ACIPY5_20025 [Microbacterium sp. NPDC089698]|uniref:ribbon-helix-helix domain-containing protein n=1 Tax=Microbacterium sp. NPDC089698 TaxID=3364200 RepID=UPI0038079A21
MSTGLDALKNRGRGERKRPIPPPQHVARAEPVALPESESAQEVAVTPDSVPSPSIAPTTVRDDAPESPGATGRGHQKSALRKEPSKVVTAKSGSKKTIHVGAEEEAFLQSVVVAGMLHPGGKVDANQSAVIRLALRRLQAELAPEAVVEEIRRGLIKTGESGRPRF